MLSICSWIVYNFFFFFVSQVRLGWHDAGTYNKNISEWPQRGGANGSLRYEIELKHGANAGNIPMDGSRPLFTSFVSLFDRKLAVAFRSCKCFEPYSAHQRHVLWDLLRWPIPTGQCYCYRGKSWTYFYWSCKYLVTRISEIQEAGGPKIPMKYGRVDTSGPHECPEEGRLPGKSTLSFMDVLRLHHYMKISINYLCRMFYRRWSSFTR